jgi:hypothetical protein
MHIKFLQNLLESAVVIARKMSQMQFPIINIAGRFCHEVKNCHNKHACKFIYFLLL